MAPKTERFRHRENIEPVAVSVFGAHRQGAGVNGVRMKLLSTGPNTHRAIRRVVFLASSHPRHLYLELYRSIHSIASFSGTPFFCVPPQFMRRARMEQIQHSFDVSTFPFLLPSLPPSSVSGSLLSHVRYTRAFIPFRLRYGLHSDGGVFTRVSSHRHHRRGSRSRECHTAKMHVRAGN